MSDENFYNTIQQTAMAEHKEKGSRFLAIAFPVQNSADAKEKILRVKKEHPKASHYCFSYRIGPDKNNFRSSDDGEPSGTAGKPILGIIDSKDLVNAMIVVVRYFGGTLLGVSGLHAAYRTAASLVLQVTPVVKLPLMSHYHLSFDYTLLNDVMTIIKSFDCVIEEQEQSMFCSMWLAIPQNQLQAALQRFYDVKNLEIRVIKSR